MWWFKSFRYLSSEVAYWFLFCDPEPHPGIIDYGPLPLAHDGEDY